MHGWSDRWKSEKHRAKSKTDLKKVAARERKKGWFSIWMKSRSRVTEKRRRGKT